MDQFTEQLLQQINESHIIVKDSIKLIVHQGSYIVAEKYIQNQMPQVGYQWFQEQVYLLTKKHYISNDDFDNTIQEDNEPNPVNIDHWRRFQGQIELVKSQQHSPIRRSETKRFTKIQMVQTQRSSENYQCQIIKMGELDDDIEFDPNIESMRQAKLRQMQIQQQKLQNDKIKNQEVQEQARQLKRLNVDSKSKYTYDFEGKVIVQKPPDIDKYPKSHQNIQEKRNLVEVRDLIPNHKQQSELINSSNRQSAYLNSINQFVTKTYVPQIDIIVMKEGVSFHDGKNEKKKDRPLPLIDIKDNDGLQNTLLNQNIHMTKLEYQTITNTQQQNNSFQNKTLQFSISQPQIQQSKTSRTFQEEQPQMYNNDSLLSLRQPKNTINQSITSNILQKLNGSISILSEEQLDGLIIQSNDINIQKEHPLFGKKSTFEITKPPPAITFELPQIPPNALTNSVSKLPRSFHSIGTFPKLLQKYPRERIDEYYKYQMKQKSIISFEPQTSSFKITYQSVNIDSDDAKTTLKYIFEQYKKIQDQLQNKFPYSSYFKVAKIDKIEIARFDKSELAKIGKNDIELGGLNIFYYYEGIDGEKLEIPYIDQKSKIDEGFKWAFPLTSNEQELKNFDIPILKSVFFNMIEIFYWSANFGLFFDPMEDCLFYYKEQEQFLFLPTFSFMTKYLFYSNSSNLNEKFLDFRCKQYQNATFNFLYKFQFQFSHLIKESDEDSSFFKDYFINKDPHINNWESLLQIEETLKGTDFLYKDDRFQKKLPKTRFKQTMLLYQLQNNQELQVLFLKYSQQDANLISQNQTFRNQFINLIEFFDKLPKQFNSKSYEILGLFMSTMNEYMKSKQLDENQITMAPYSKVTSNQHKIEIISNQPRIEVTSNQNKNEITNLQQQKPQRDNEQFEFIWSSSINKFNRLIIDQKNQQMLQEELQIKYFFIFNNSSIIIKTHISEVQFSIDTADDIIYLANMIIREPTAINIYVDESRKLTLQTSIQTASPMEIFRIAIKIFDMLQIYYHMILEFYLQNIQLGRSIKDKKYQSFVNEIQHYVQDYEIDFDEQMKKFDPKSENIKKQ